MKSKIISRRMTANPGTEQFITDRDEAGKPKVPVEAAAGSSNDAFVTDRDESGNPKKPERMEVPRIAQAKANPAGDAANALAMVPTEIILKIVGDLPKEDDFQQNPQKQNALIYFTNLLAQRPIEPKPEELAAASAPAKAAAKKTAQPGEFGGKKAPEFTAEDVENNVPVKKEKESSKKVAVSPPGWGGTVEQMKEYKDDIDNPWALAWYMKGEGAKPHYKETSLDEWKAAQAKMASDPKFKYAVSPPGWKKTVEEMKEHEDGIENPWALAWSMKEKGYKPHAGSFLLKRKGAAWLQQKFAADMRRVAGQDGSWSWNQSTGDVEESGGRTPEVEEAHRMINEKPAKLDRPDTVLPIKLAAETSTSKALKMAESAADKLKSLYLETKPVCEANDTRPVREAVEAIYHAHAAFNEAMKVLSKQEEQEKQEAEAAEIKTKKKSSVLGGLVLAAAE